MQLQQQLTPRQKSPLLIGLLTTLLRPAENLPREVHSPEALVL
jgi:hypothetical protein